MSTRTPASFDHFEKLDPCFRVILLAPIDQMIPAEQRTQTFNLSNMCRYGVKMVSVNFFASSGTNYDPFKVDIWSLGVILYAMTIGYMPFNDNKQIARMRLGVSFRNVKQEITKTLRGLLCRILVNEPNERPIVDEILDDDWFRAGFADVCVAAVARQHKRLPCGLSEGQIMIKKSRMEGSQSIG